MKLGLSFVGKKFKTVDGGGKDSLVSIYDVDEFVGTLRLRTKNDRVLWLRMTETNGRGGTDVIAERTWKRGREPRTTKVPDIPMLAKEHVEALVALLGH